MRRYFFNLHTEQAEATDLVGVMCRDDIAALSEAFRRACDAAQAQLSRLDAGLNGAIEVENDRHQVVMTVPIKAAAY
jgi:hypothetical protein